MNKDKWAVGTTKKFPAEEKVPKFQQYKDYYFPDKTPIDPEKYKSFFLKTDNISIRIPKFNKREETSSYLNMKSKFGSHTETYKDSWVPQGNFKTMNNRSSVGYNIINCENNNTSGAVTYKILDNKLANKKKGIAEFTDLSQPNNPSINPIYKSNFESNPKIFNVYNGIFSHMYDASHRNGNISVPFRNGGLLSSEANASQTKFNSHHLAQNNSLGKSHSPIRHTSRNKGGF